MSEGLTHAVAGAAGGIVSTVLTYPLFTVSSRLSVQGNDKSAKAYRGATDAACKIYSTEGLSGLYSGLSSAIFGITVTNSVYYYWYETVKGAIQRSAKRVNMTTAESMLAGSIAGALTAVLTNPIWLINTRLTVKKSGAADVAARSERVTAWKMFRKVVKEDGVLALWQGILPALILVTNPIIQYTAFDQLKWRAESLSKFHRKSSLTSFDFFILGAIAKLCATSITFPYIVIKTRMQTGLKDKSNNAPQYKSIFDAFAKILAQEGMQGLYKGLSSKLLQSVLNAAIMFAAKEKFYNFAVLALAAAGIRKQVAANAAPSVARR